MYWPSAQDYNEAVQTPLSSFTDQALRESEVETTPLGLPRCVSGNFASVYCLAHDERKVALRCFLQNVPDQEHRYTQISDFVMHDDLPYTVPFQYIKEGIKIKGEWYPVLKMHWVEGTTLTQFVEKNLGNGQAISLLASNFKQMTIEFHRAGIAHGDLQHDNILISDDELRLVDYDGMFVPGLTDSKANELGHRNYQHPQRDRDFFSPSLDNFSSWIIYASLKSLAIDPSLWESLKGGDDCLLLRHSDFTTPTESQRLQLLLQHDDNRIQKYASVIQSFLSGAPNEVPPIDSEVVGRALVVVPKSTNITKTKDENPAPAKVEVLQVLPADIPLHTAIKVFTPPLVLLPGAGWAPQSEVLATISTQLAPNEVVTWQSRVLRDDRWIGDALFVMIAIATFIPLMMFQQFGAFILFAGLIMWIRTRSRMSNSDRMYFLTSASVLCIRSSLVEVIPFDNILNVEETALGVTVVLLQSALPTITSTHFRNLDLDDADTKTFFNTLPKSVARRRL